MSTRPGFGVFRNLSLFSKLMLPFFTLILVLGLVGGFVTVRDLSARTRASVDQALLVRSLDARSLLRDRELYLLESANFASNVQGMAVAVHNHDDATALRLLRSVKTLKTDLVALAVVDRAGRDVADVGAGGRTGSESFVAQATQGDGRRVAGMVLIGAKPAFAIASPICSRIAECAPVGASVVALTADSIVERIVDRPSSSSSVTLWNTAGARLTSSGALVAPAPPANVEDFQTRSAGPRGERTATAYVPVSFGGTRLGAVGVTISTAAEFAAARRAARNLALVLLVALIGIVAIGALLTRLILRQVRPLVATNRALGGGDLTARAPVLGRDELGELASGVNQMADQLQANVETLELRVAQRTDEIRRLLKERTEFFASLSHEFRTPLAVILRQADMTRHGKRVSREQAGRAWEIVHDSAGQLLNVVNDILQLAKAETGHLEIAPEPTDVASFLGEIEPTLAELGRRGGLDVRVVVPKGLPAVQADPVRLREVIVNLVDNAVKYTPTGGRIEVAASERNGSIDLLVRDQGVGIPEDSLERIFTPFYRVKGVATQHDEPSSGLGLPIAKWLVEAQGGSIAVDSEPGEGSTFTVTLPKSPG